MKPRITVNKRFRNVQNTVKFIDFVDKNPQAFTNAKLICHKFDYNTKQLNRFEIDLKRIYIQKNLKIEGVETPNHWPNWTFSIFDCIIILHSYEIDIYYSDRFFKAGEPTLKIQFDKNYIRGLKLNEI
jgi:hypothetical protein